MKTVILQKDGVNYSVPASEMQAKLESGFYLVDSSVSPSTEDALIKINLIDEPQVLKDKLDCTLSQAKEVIKSRPYASFEDLTTLNETLTKPINWSSFQSKIVFDI
jgi:hypothetical protein